MIFPRLVLPLCTALLLAACSADPAPAPAPTDAAAPKLLAAVRAEQASLGAPGADYDPRGLSVNFHPDAVVPRGLEGSPPVPAASRPNPLLRTRPNLEALADSIAARYGIAINRQAYLGRVNMASFTVPSGLDAAAVLARLRVEYAAQLRSAEFERIMHPCKVPNDTYWSSGADEQWGWKRSRFDHAWDTTTGAATELIAIVDTGVYLDHADLAGQVLDPLTAFPAATCDLANNDNTMEDNDGHGTFLAGIVGSLMDNSFGLAGAAPGCRVIPIKISDTGGANHSLFIEGCLLGNVLGARVINLSWRSTGGSPGLSDMVDELRDRGALLFVSAGNDGTSDMTWPAAYEHAIAVGNSNRSDGRAPSSSFGEWVDIAAPGEDFVSCGNHAPDDYHGPSGGTSFSAPLTAAAAALLWSRDPLLSHDAVRALLLDNAGVATGFNGSNSLPLLDVGAAMDAVGPLVPPAQISQVQLAQSLVGSVPARLSLSAQVSNPVAVDHVTYTLDLLPLDNGGPEDVQLTGSAGFAYAVNFALDAALPNQVAKVRARAFNALGEPGAEAWDNVYIFNRRGDANADGRIDAADRAGFIPRLGLASGEPGYLPFCDTDLDGRITEADAAAVAYFWAP